MFDVVLQGHGLLPTAVTGFGPTIKTNHRLAEKYILPASQSS